MDREKLTKEQRAARGAHAKQLDSDPLLNELMDKLEDRWLKSIANSKPNEAESREAAYTMLFGAKSFRAELRALINDAALISDKS